MGEEQTGSSEKKGSHREEENSQLEDPYERDRERNAKRKAVEGKEETGFIANKEEIEYGQQQTGIRIEYQLSYQEAIKIVKQIPGYEIASRRARTQIFLLTILIVALMLAYRLTGGTMNLYLCILSIILVAVIGLAPWIRNRSEAKGLVRKGPVELKIYSDKIIEIKGREERHIELNGTAKYRETDRAYMIFPRVGRWMFIPVDRIEQEYRADIQAMLIAGTTPFDGKE